MNEKNINSIIPLAENISVLVEQNNNVPVNNQIEVLLEIITEFTKILESKIASAYKSEQIQKSMKETFFLIGNSNKTKVNFFN